MKQTTKNILGVAAIVVLSAGVAGVTTYKMQNKEKSATCLLYTSEVCHILQHGAHKYGKTARNYQQKGYQQEHREVIRYFTVHASCFFYLPDAVEGNLHVVNQVEHRPQ